MAMLLRLLSRQRWRTRSTLPCRSSLSGGPPGTYASRSSALKKPITGQSRKCESSASNEGTDGASGNRDMRSMKKPIVIVLCAAGFSGCFTSNVLVTIRPDGSGTVEQTTTIRPADILKFQKLVSPDTPASLLDPAAFRDLRREFEKSVQGLRQATNFRLRSSRPIETADSTGWQLIYDFSEISTLSLDLLPQIPGARGFIAAKGDMISTRVMVTIEPIAEGLERYTFRFPKFEMDPSAEPPASWA